MKTVYLAGPIVGCDFGEANNWREDVCKWFERNLFGKVCGISPLRCEELPGTQYNMGAVDPLFGSDEAVATKNLYDVGATDLTLAYVPRALEERRPVYGTISEIAWAKLLRKPVILVSDAPRVMNHPVIKASCGWRVERMEDALKIVAGLFSDYP